MRRKLTVLVGVACVVVFGVGTLPRLTSAHRKARSMPIPTVARSANVPGATPAWLDAIGRSLDKMQREIRLADDGSGDFWAMSKACSLVLDSDGVKILPAWYQDKWSIDWSWCSIQGLEATPPRFTRVASSELQVDRGSILEIFDNKSSGLEHIIEVKERPRNSPSLRVDIALKSNLSLASAKPLDAVEFSEAGSRVLQYRGLKVWDADGEVLAASFAVTPSGFSISIDDAKARYPVTIDPVFASLDWEENGDVGPPFNPGGQFGYSVASAGDLDADGTQDLIVGAPFFTSNPVQPQGGAAHVYYGDAGGNPDADADVIVFGQQSGAGFGWSVAGNGDLDGNTDLDFVVGAPFFDVPGGTGDEGAAFGYLQNAFSQAWYVTNFMQFTQAQGFQDEQPSGWHGYSVAIVGDVSGDGADDVVVGAPQCDVPGVINGGLNIANAGVITFYSQGVGWTFGTPVDRADGSLWGPGAQVEDPDDDALFGWCVARAGDNNGDTFNDVLVGAPGFIGNTGRAFYYFADGGGELMPGPAWTDEGADEAGAQFGYSIAGNINVDGDLGILMDAIVGSPFYDGDGTDIGRVFLYLGDDVLGLVADPEEDWSPMGENNGDQFGLSLAWAVSASVADTGLIIVGAPGFNADTGRAYAYTWDGTLSTLDIQADNPASYDGDGNVTTAMFGTSVAILTDFDGDGELDGFVGSPGFDVGAGQNQTDVGRIDGFFDN